MNKITSQEALMSAFNAAKGKIALRSTDIHDINSVKKDILCCGGTGCHASNAKELMENLNKYIKENGLENAAVLLGRRDDIHDMLKAVSVVIIPSSFEGFPLAGIESAAAGTPIAACDVAGAKELIEMSKAGVVYEENNIQSAVSAILTIKENPEEMRENGRAFSARASLPEYQRQLSAVFESL